MAKLVDSERIDIERRLHDPKWISRLLRVQKIIEGEFTRIRDQAETMMIRAILPRPSIKELSSAIQKIERYREAKVYYSLSNVEDLIGIKISCPYPSDRREVIKRMRAVSGFVVRPEEDEKAKILRKGGYRGYHYTVQLDWPLLLNNEDLEGIKCEVQIKTMFEESWDAKTHDVTYKQKKRIDPELTRAMRLLSDELTVLDDWSESLKDKILQRETEERKRKEGVAAVYLYQSQTFFNEILSKVQTAPEKQRLIQEMREGRFDADSVMLLIPVISDYRRRADLSTDLCRIAGLVGLFASGKHLDTWALDICDELIQKKTELPTAYLTKGSVCWALDRLDEAIEVTQLGIEKAKTLGHLEIVADGQGNFAYWVAERVWSGQEVEADTIEHAKTQLELAIRQQPAWLPHIDTKGFLLITTAETKEQIKLGQDLIREIRSKLAGTNLDTISLAFYQRHETIALICLAALGSEK